MSPAQEALEALLAVMARLRDPLRGCPWDLAQDFASIAPYTIEEAYEVADAIESGVPTRLQDELGDLLFQVVFHARLAEERGWFGFEDVARGIHDKLIRRHPHVFEPQATQSTESTQLMRSWEEIKARERSAAQAAMGGPPGPPPGALSGVPRALPALARAAKLGRRAGRVGFDWADAAAVREKVMEELAEVDAEVPGAPGGTPDPESLAEELGDLLFATANWSRHLGVDPEEALRRANGKFERRFAAMEVLARSQGLEPDSLSAGQWEALWMQAKAHEQR